MSAKRKNITPDPEDPVEEALLRRALGFQQQEIHSEDLIDKKTGEVLESAKRRVVTKEIPPDVRALLFWLKNRKPERWKDRNDHAILPDFDLGEEEDSL
ncbi:MAG: hypothetical protein AB7F32_04430 [Victivallaceae bacterium]